MPKRFKLEESKPTGGGKYFDNPTDVRCFSSGATLLDCVLSGPRNKGGWALGRISNVCGDKSTGKTGLAIEATANFCQEFPDKKKHKVKYREVEAAFDPGYAQMIGLDLNRVELPDEQIDTVEEFFTDLDGFIKSVPQHGAGLYILDSLDAIGDKDEQEGEFGKASYGTKKARLMGQLFRRTVRRIENRQIHVMIVSQLRDKIGVTFGEKNTRTGGRALDYYASQVVWLADLGKVVVTKGGVKRPIGNKMRARCKKNKIALPFRDCDYSAYYAYGIDDVEAGVEWLESVKLFDLANDAKKYLSAFGRMNSREANAERAKVSEAVRLAWKEVESRFLPTRSKYGQ